MEEVLEVLRLGIRSSKSKAFGQEDKVLEVPPLDTYGKLGSTTFGHEVLMSLGEINDDLKIVSCLTHV